MQMQTLWFRIGTVVVVVGLLATLYGCGEEAQQSSEEVGTPSAPVGRTVQDPPDPTDVSEELKTVYEHIDANFDAHVARLVEWVRIPSISDLPEGQEAILESAEFIKDVITTDLGCTAEVYDPGMGDWGTPGNRVVYGRCDVGAEKTIIDYVQGDVMPIWPEEEWPAPPFEGRIIEKAPFKRVMVGRGAGNSKGPSMAHLNALISIKAVTGTLPVNMIFILDHDEEREEIGLRKFMFDHADFFDDADAMFSYHADQLPDGRGQMEGQSIGSAVFELETNVLQPGRRSDAPTVDSMSPGVGLWLAEQPMWRHFEMLRILAEDSPLRKDLNEDVLPPSAEEEAYLRREAGLSGVDFDSLMKVRNNVRVSITGTWGGNMAPGYAGHHRPSVVASKIDIRFPPNVDGNDVIEKVRTHLDEAGYQDVKLKVIGIVDWSWANADNEIGQAAREMYRQFNVPINEPPKGNYLGAYTAYGPSYLFTRGPLTLPVVYAGLGYGWGYHFGPEGEYYVIEGDGEKIYGFAGAMKSYATVLYNYASQE